MRSSSVTTGGRLLDFRLQRGLTQTALAEESGVNQSTIWRIENQQAEARVGTLTALASALKVKVADLLP